MKRRIKSILILILIISFIFTGCSSVKNSQSQAASSASGTSTAGKTTSDTESTMVSGSTTNGAFISTSSKIVVDKDFTSSDLEVGYDESKAVTVTLKGSSIEASGKGVKIEDNIITISKKGTYIFSGTLKDGQIVVDAGDKDKVHLVLNGVSIYCSDNAPVYIKNADKVFITLETDTENNLSDGTEYDQKDDNTVDGVIFSKADLTINGEGILNITGNYKHGIAVKNQLTITGGTYNITAEKDDINGNDGLRIKAGTFTLSSKNGNGLSTKNGENDTKGFVYICGGSINITSCVEGIEGTAILIEDGKITITSQDDGFNASDGAVSSSDTNPFENDENCYISISGGTVNIDASGDGIDSNGSLYVSGGTIYVSGPIENNNGGLDYNGTAEITGGTIIVAGSTGMAQGFSDTSTQYSLLYNLTSECNSGTEITLTDGNDKVVASFTPNKQYQSVVISTPDLAKDKTYTLTCGDQKADITLSSVVTSNGQSQQMGGPMGGQPGDRRGMTKPGNTN